MIRPGRARAPKSLAELAGRSLDPVLAKRGFGQNDILLHWEAIAGARLGAVSQPLRLQWPTRGTQGNERSDPATLIVQIEGAFAIEMQHLATLLCERINGRLGWRCVGRIALRQGPVAPRLVRRRTLPPADPASLQAAQALSAGILDPALKEALVRLGGRALGGRGPR